MNTDTSRFDFYMMGVKEGFKMGWEEARMQFLIRGSVPSLEEPSVSEEEPTEFSEQ